MRPEAELKVRIGLEVHCQLTALKTKLFCSCSSDYRTSEPNTKVCPVCFGLPGTLPVLNAKAVEYATMIGLALNCRISERSLFYRKNYFYPDLPKGFQITQYDKAGGVPVASSGFVEVEGKKVRITRIQIEEDPGKLTYEGTIEKSSYSLVDYNRAGIALVEIVTEPDIEDAREAKKFLEKLRSIIESLGVSNGELDGAMRCDANVSLVGGARVEIKNISSFKEVEKALNYEILRQGKFSGGTTSETRHWDERRSITIALRSKEEEQDYRYFPEPDLPAIVLEPGEIERIRGATPEAADAKASRFASEYGMTLQLAKELAASRALSSFFEECARLGSGRGEVASFILAEMGRESQISPSMVSPAQFVDLMRMVEAKSITRAQAKEVLGEMARTGESVKEIVKTRRFSAISDEEAIGRIVEKVISGMPEMAAKARADPKVLGYLVGQVRKEEPSAVPSVVARVLAQKIKKA